MSAVADLAMQRWFTPAFRERDPETVHAFTAMGAIAGTWFHDYQLGGVIAAAMIINLIAAALAGILLPLLLDKVGADPAIASSVFVTTVTDCTGFFAFLGIATWWFGI